MRDNRHRINKIIQKLAPKRVYASLLVYPHENFYDKCKQLEIDENCKTFPDEKDGPPNPPSDIYVSVSAEPIFAIRVVLVEEL